MRANLAIEELRELQETISEEVRQREAIQEHPIPTVIEVGTYLAGLPLWQHLIPHIHHR